MTEYHAYFKTVVVSVYPSYLKYTENTMNDLVTSASKLIIVVTPFK